MPEQTITPALLRPEEACELLMIKRHTLTQLNIPFVQIGTARRYRREDLEPFLTETHVVDLTFRQTNPLPRCDLYFIRNIESSRIKIGAATNTEKRRLALEGASGYRMETLGRVARTSDLEGALHVAFRHTRHIGEWFNPSEELLSLSCRPRRDTIMDFLRRKEAEGDIKLFSGKAVLMAYPWRKR